MEMSISNINRDKSFVDDLNKEQGIVSMRVGSALRSTEIKPLFPDLFFVLVAHSCKSKEKLKSTPCQGIVQAGKQR